MYMQWYPSLPDTHGSLGLILYYKAYTVSISKCPYHGGLRTFVVEDVQEFE